MNLTRLSLLPLTILSFLCSFQTALASSFKDFVWPHLESLDIQMPPHQSFETGEAPILFQSSGDERLVSLLKLYEGVIVKDKSIKLPLEWKAERLASPFHLKKARPIPRYYNDHLIWAYSGKIPVAIFRPIDTSTDCDTGCTPVVFHLRYSVTTKNVIELIEEAAWPLRKIYHKEFTVEDKKKALELAQKLPQGLELIQHPNSLADSENHFPPQTWTVHKPFLVEGAAYTSYRIFEAALKTKEAFSKKKNRETVEKSQLKINDWIVSVLDIPDTKVGRNFLDRELKSLNLPSETRFKGVQAQFLPYLALWISSESGSSAALKQMLNNSNLGKYFQSELCKFSRNIVFVPNGPKLLLDLFSQKISFCGIADRATEFVAMALAQTSPQDLKLFFEKHRLPVLPPRGFQNKPKVFKSYIDALDRVLDSQSMLKVFADLAVRFPQLMNPAVISKFSKEDRALYEKYIVNSQQVVKNELIQTLEPAPRSEFPKLTFRDQNGNFRIFDAPKEGKQILLFFASWCPHCQKTIKHWMNEAIQKQLSKPESEEFWKKIQIIEIFGNGQPSVKEFCQLTSVPKSECEKILIVEKDSSQEKILVEKISLMGVPRIILLDKKGGITQGDFDIHKEDESTVLRNLLWISQTP
jgi:thiol-disulfide isomerase/thioredoxin